jgi:hypothetical protein
MSTAASALALALALVPAPLPRRAAPAGPQRTAADWVEELVSGSYYEAHRELVALGAREALPALVACVSERPPAAGWQAVRVIRDLPADSARDRSAARDAAKALAGLLAAEDPGRRQVAARALGALGANAEKASDELAARLAEDESAAVRMASAHALAGLGEVAVKPLRKLLEHERVMPRAWSLSTLAMLGESGAKAQKALDGLARDEDSFQAFLLARLALRALEGIGESEAALRASAARYSLEGGRHWVTQGELNWGGIVEPTPPGWLRAVLPLTGLDPAPHPADVALPPEFEPTMAKFWTLAEGYQQLLAHLGAEVARLRAEVDSDALPRLEDWGAAAAPVLRLAEVLGAMGRLVPAE